MKNKITIIFVLLFLATAVYSIEDLCNLKQTCLQKDLSDVQQKIGELQELNVDGVAYLDLQERSIDIPVSIQALYEEATLYKNLAQLRSEYEKISQEALIKKEFLIPKRQRVTSTSELTIDLEDEIIEEGISQEETIVQEPELSKDIILDSSRLNFLSRNIRLSFQIFEGEGKWYWCPLKLFDEDQCSEIETSISEFSPQKNDISEEQYKIINSLADLNFNYGAEHLLEALIDIRTKEDSNMIFKVGDINIKTKAHETKIDTIDLEIGDETFTSISAIAYKEVRGKREITKIGKWPNYNKALKTFKEVLIERPGTTLLTEEEPPAN